MGFWCVVRAHILSFKVKFWVYPKPAIFRLFMHTYMFQIYPHHAGRSMYANCKHKHFFNFTAVAYILGCVPGGCMRECSVHARALSQDSCKTLCPSCSLDAVAAHARMLKYVCAVGRARARYVDAHVPATHTTALLPPPLFRMCCCYY